MLTLSTREAALCIGTSKGRVYRAIQSGRLRAHRGAFGRYAIEPRELFRVFLPQFQHANWNAPSLDRSEMLLLQPPSRPAFLAIADQRTITDFGPEFGSLQQCSLKNPGLET